MKQEFIIENKELLKYTGLKEVIKIPEEIEIIKENCFFANHHIKEIVLSKNTKVIEDRAFKFCKNLEKINLENIENIGKQSFLDTNLKEIKLEHIKEIDEGAFRNTNINEVCLPSTINKIGKAIFFNSNLKKAIVNCDLKDARGTFDVCFKLEELIINNNEKFDVKRIGTVNSLKKINVNNSNCQTINNIVYDKNYKELIYCTPCIDKDILQISNEIKTINEYAFANNRTLKKIIFGENIEEIKSNAFLNSQINEIITNSKLKNIDSSFNFSSINKIDLSQSNIEELDLSKNGFIDIDFNNTKCYIKPYIKEIILPNKIKNLKYISDDDVDISELSNLLKIAQPKEKFNKEIQNIIEKFDIQRNYTTIDVLLESGKTFREINTIISNQER